MNANQQRQQEEYKNQQLQRKVGRIFIWSFGGLAVVIVVSLYFSGYFSAFSDSNYKNFPNKGFFVATSRRVVTSKSRPSKDIWTNEKIVLSGNTYELYSMTPVGSEFPMQVKCYETNFNVGDTIYLYYRDVYFYDRGDSSYFDCYLDSSISIPMASQRGLKLRLLPKP